MSDRKIVEVYFSSVRLEGSGGPRGRLVVVRLTDYDTDRLIEVAFDGRDLRELQAALTAAIESVKGGDDA